MGDGCPPPRPAPPSDAMNEPDSRNISLSRPAEDDPRTALLTRGRTCPDCTGSGTSRHYFGDAFGSFEWGPCDKCRGRGRV